MNSIKEEKKNKKELPVQLTPSPENPGLQLQVNPLLWSVQYPSSEQL